MLCDFQKHGEFMAAASDVLDVWNQMYQDTVASRADTEESCEELDLPSISQRCVLGCRFWG